MAFRYHITTTQAEKMEERLKFMEAEMLKYKVGAVNWKRRGNEFWISLEYLTQNRVYDMVVCRKFEGRVRIIDRDAKIEKV
jgi:hypothetical protein